jgi:hypothetical protein
MRDQMRRAVLVSHPATMPLSLLFVILLQTPGITQPSRRLPLLPHGVFAQAGNAGGSVAKQSKSVSGDQETVKLRKTEKAPAGPSERKILKVHAPSERKSPQPTSKAESLGIYNGTWSGLSTGACIPNYSWTVHVSNGMISGNNTSGNISRGGSLRASMIVNAYKYSVVGRANSTQASGTWATTGNCSGRWTATRT